jgi:lysine biosynthesis protein LysW
MTVVICAVCGAEVELDEDVKENDIVACPVCGVSLRIFQVDGVWEAEEA